MKNLASTVFFLSSIGGILALPMSDNAVISRSDAASLPPWLAAYLYAGLNSGYRADAAVNQPSSSGVTQISASPPAGGINVGGSGGKAGSITTSTPATSGGAVVSVPAGASISVTGENGSVSSGGDNQGNGGSVTVNAGGGDGNNTLAAASADA